MLLNRMQAAAPSACALRTAIGITGPCVVIEVSAQARPADRHHTHAPDSSFHPDGASRPASGDVPWRISRWQRPTRLRRCDRISPQPGAVLHPKLAGCLRLRVAVFAAGAGERRLARTRSSTSACSRSWARTRSATQGAERISRARKIVRRRKPHFTMRVATHNESGDV